MSEDWRDNLSDLPDIADAELFEETLPTGETVVHRRCLKFVKWKKKDTDPVIFTDAEGSWFVVYGLEGGPYKRRA